MKEVKNLVQFESWVNGAPELEPAAIQALDLSKHEELIRNKSFPDSIFLGCKMQASIAGQIVQTGGVVIPDLKGFKFKVHLNALYSVKDLFFGFDINDPKGTKQLMIMPCTKSTVAKGNRHP